MSDGELAFGAVLLLVMFAIFGVWIGRAKGQSGKGAALGALLGPAGLVVTACLPDKKECSECKGKIPMDARRCMHCGFVFPQAESPTNAAHWAPVEPDDYFVVMEGKPQGPFTAEQVRKLFSRTVVTDKTQICRNGEDAWTTIGERQEIFGAKF